MTTDTKAAAARLTFLTGILALTKEQIDAQRADTGVLMEPGEAHPVRCPLTGEILARVRKAKDRTVAVVTDHVALTEWIGREYPDRIDVSAAVSDRTAEVLEVLREHAPHLVEVSTSIPAWATDEVVRLSTKAGHAVGPGGELDVPGIAMETVEGSVSVAEKHERYGDLIRDLATAGALGADGSVRALPAAEDGPIVVDAEPATS